jgi:hypothetical protein
MLFSYRKGNIHTNKRWLPPSKKRLFDIYIDNLNFFNKYECYLYGNFLLNPNNTKDIDILIASDIDSIAGEDCVNLCNFAHDKRQLIDLSILDYDYFNSFRGQIEHFNRTKNWIPLSTNNIKVVKPHDNLTVTIDGEIVYYENEDYRKVKNNLWYKIRKNKLPEKYVKREKFAIPINIHSYFGN